MNDAEHIPETALLKLQGFTSSHFAEHNQTEWLDDPSVTIFYSIYVKTIIHRVSVEAI